MHALCARRVLRTNVCAKCRLELSLGQEARPLSALAKHCRQHPCHVVIKPRGTVAFGASHVSAKKWSADKTDGYIRALTVFGELYETMTAAEFVRACRSLDNASPARRHGMIIPVETSAIRQSLQPVRSFVETECTGKLLPVIGTVCASMSIWLEGFADESLPLICGRLSSKLDSMEVSQVVSLVSVIPRPSTAVTNLCNEAAHSLLRRSASLTTAQRMCCVSKLHFGSQPQVFEFLQHCVDRLASEPLATLPLLQLLDATSVANSSHRLRLSAFLAPLVRSIEGHAELDTHFTPVLTASYQLAVNGFDLSVPLVTWIADQLHGLALDWPTLRFSQLLTVLGSVPGQSKRQLVLEHLTVRALAQSLAQVPDNCLLTLLKVARRSLCRHADFISIVSSLLERLPARQISLQNLKAVLEATKEQHSNPVLRPRLADWCLTSLETQLPSLQSGNLQLAVQCGLELANTLVTDTSAGRFHGAVTSIAAHACSQAGQLYSIAELEVLVSLMRQAEVQPYISQLQSLFMPRLALSAPPAVVRCLRAIHDAFGASQAAVVQAGIAALGAAELAGLTLDDQVWMLSVFQNSTDTPYSQGIPLLQSLLSHINSGQLPTSLLCRFGRLSCFREAGDELNVAAFQQLLPRLSELNRMERADLLTMVTSRFIVNLNDVDKVKKAIVEFSEGTALSKFSLLTQTDKRSLQSLHGPDVLRLLEQMAAEVPGTLPDIPLFYQYVDVLRQLYHVKMAGHGRCLAQCLGAELERYYGDARRNDLPNKFALWLATIGMVTPVPHRLLNKFAVPALFVGRNALPMNETVCLVHAFASVGYVPRGLRPALADHILKNWSEVAQHENRLKSSLIVLSCLDSPGIMQIIESDVPGATYAALYLGNLSCQHPVLLGRLVYILQEALPESRWEWAKILSLALVHCARVPCPEALRESLSWLVANLDAYGVPTWHAPLSCCAEWATVCQTGRLAVSAGLRAVTSSATLASFQLPLCEQHSAEIVLLLDAVSRLQRQESLFATQICQSLATSHCLAVSQLYWARYDRGTKSEAGCSEELPLHSLIHHWLQQDTANSQAGLLPLSLGRLDPSPGPPATENVPEELSLRVCDPHSDSAETRLVGEELLAGVMSVTDEWDMSSEVQLDSVALSQNQSFPPESESGADSKAVCGLEGVSRLHDSSSQEDVQASSPEAAALLLPSDCADLFDDVSNAVSCVHGPLLDRATGILVDAALALDSQGAVLDFQSVLDHQSDQVLPWGPPEWPAGTASRIALIALHPEHHVRFSTRLRSDVLAKMRLLEAYGWLVQTVHMDSLMSENRSHCLKSAFRQIQRSHTAHHHLRLQQQQQQLSGASTI